MNKEIEYKRNRARRAREHCEIDSAALGTIALRTLFTRANNHPCCDTTGPPPRLPFLFVIHVQYPTSLPFHPTPLHSYYPLVDGLPCAHSPTAGSHPMQTDD